MAGWFFEIAYPPISRCGERRVGGREGERELARFLSIAAGSASEAEYQLLLARDLGYLDQEPHEQLDALANELKRMLNSFIQRLSQLLTANG